MRVAVLSAVADQLAEIIGASGDSVVKFGVETAEEEILASDADLLVSYGYRRILSDEALTKLPGRAINIHISLLPWNRGADPNFWSWLDDTPKGVSIHLIDRGIDTGDLIAQREISFPANHTLRTSYNHLQQTALGLFCETWDRIRRGHILPTQQLGAGSIHRKRDLEPYQQILVQGWDTPVSLISAAGHSMRLRKHEPL